MCHGKVLDSTRRCAGTLLNKFRLVCCKLVHLCIACIACMLILPLLLLQVTTPVAIMTSDAKGNHDRISSLMDSQGWFGRAPDSFRLFR